MSGLDVTGDMEMTKKRLRSEFAIEHPNIGMSEGLEEAYGMDPVVRPDNGMETSDAPDIPEIKQEPLDPGFAEAFGALPEPEEAPPRKRRRRQGLKDKKKSAPAPEKETRGRKMPGDMKLQEDHAVNILREKYESELMAQEQKLAEEVAKEKALGEKALGEKALEEKAPEETGDDAEYAPSLFAADHREDIEKKRKAMQALKEAETAKPWHLRGMTRAGLYVSASGFAMMAGSYFL